MAAINLEFEEPRKIELPSQEACILANLESLPLKRRLEILFIANIIPSRRQLANKYGLDELFVHNVLSHRSYILKNWKYSADAERFLAKVELEKAMALMEILLEWKRRVELSGLQITHSAMLRKAIALRKALKVTEVELNDDWWQLFNENWSHKQFRDSESDSLQVEDILNDLQWLFGEAAYKRLAMQFRCARNERACVGVSAYARSRKCKISDTVPNFCEDQNEPLDASDIESEPFYYNDDEFDCEDYEFVLDEELVLESLRRELTDAETAKYIKYFGCDDNSDDGYYLVEKIEDAEEFIDLSSNAALETHSDLAFSEVTQTRENAFMAEATAPVVQVSIAPAWSINESEADDGQRQNFKDKASSQAQLESEHLDVTAAQSESSILNVAPCPPLPKPFKRKPREMNAKLTIRKDFVRLPVSTEVSHYTFISKLEAPENLPDELETAPSKYVIQNCDNQNMETSPTTLLPSPTPSVDLNAKAQLDDLPNTSIKEALMDDLPNTSIDDEFQEIEHFLDEEAFKQQTVNDENKSFDPFGDFTISTQKKISLAGRKSAVNKTRKSKRLINRRPLNNTSSVKTDPDTLENDNSFISDYIEPKLDILSIANPTSASSSHIGSCSGTGSDRRKQNFKDKVKVTSVRIFGASQAQLLPQLRLTPTLTPKSTSPPALPSPSTTTAMDEQTLDHENITDEFEVSNGVQFTENNSKHIEPPPMKPPQLKSNVFKRGKRRTDCSDLRLRKDKVRISLIVVSDHAGK